MLSRKRAVILLMLGAVSYMAGCSNVESVRTPDYNFDRIEKVAVVDVTGDLQGRQTRNQIGNFIGFELMRNGYRVIERQKVQTLLEEQQFQQGEITQAAEAARAGQVLNVPVVAMADVRVRSERVDMTIKMVDVETAEMVWMGRGSGKTQRTLATAGGALVGAAGGALLGGDTEGRVVGGVLGGALGGGAGYALTSDQAQLVKGIVNKIGKEMPQRMMQTR